MANIINALTEKYIKRVNGLKLNFTRSGISMLDTDHRLLGLKGARGTGKTVLLLQYAKQQPDWRTKVLYASLDNFWFTTNTIYALADDFVKQGGHTLLLDEVHKYPNWAQELKNVYDDIPELKIIFTGSSLLQILNAQADLSRRAVVHHLQGLSFREYLALKTGTELPIYSLDEIISNSTHISDTVLQELKPLAHFENYLKKGYYPFFKESETLYYHKLEAVANLILDIELPLLRKLDVAYVAKLKQLLAVLAESTPFIPNMSKLSERIGINRGTLLQYVHYLQEAGLLVNLFKKTHGISQLQKPNKIFLDNSNLACMLSPKTEIGAVRETFFANQVGHLHQINYPPKGDFLVNQKMIFEVGGKNKGSSQIKDNPNGYLALDGIEYGSGRTIPLWQFGFMY